MSNVRVLQIITRLIVGGAQETAILVADGLDKSRWSTDLICGPQTGPEGSLIEEARRRGIPLTIEPSLVREIRPLKDLFSLIHLTRLIKRGKYTIVHTNSSKAGILGRWAAYFAGTPIIVHTVHGWGHNERQHAIIRFFYILFEKITLCITSRLITVTPLDIKKGLRSGIGRPENYKVIRSGIELDRFGHPGVSRDQVRTKLDIPLDVPVIGTVTRLSPQKAPLDFLRAASIITKHIPEAWFVMVGDGPMRKECEEFVKASGLTERLILTGLRRDIPELLTAFDVFVLSSLWEGLPRVLPQAMATGLPIVATAVDGNVEAVVNGENGVLVSPGQPSDLADAIIDILKHPDRRAELGQAGKERAVEFGADKMVEELSDLYKLLLTQQNKVTRLGS